MSISNVPVIDIDELHRPETLAALDRACREWGFFQVTNHGIPADVIAAMNAAMRSFFAQPIDVKRRISRTADNAWGFFDRELTKNITDWKQVFDVGRTDTHAQRQQWPAGMPEFRNAVTRYYRYNERLALRLLSAISVNLGMSRGFLSRGFGPDNMSFLRLNYYPVCPHPAAPEGLANPAEGHLGVNHHTDAGALTLLLQDNEPGLEVFRDNTWHLIEPRSDALVINIGDMVQVWSNDRYCAALHRGLTNPERARYSVPFFLCPSYDTNYAPVPSMLANGELPRYRTINWGEFRTLRTAGDYADLGEEVQITHYRKQA
jgi:isopenicillin N synthase-like dioxygenase